MIASILARLMEPGTPFRIVGGAGELSDVKDRPAQTPAVYAYVSSDSSGANERIGGLLQRTEALISIVYVTTNLSQQNNAAATADVEVLKKYGRRKLLGFLPAGAADPLTHAEGEIQQALSGTVWFEDVFATAYYQTKEN